MCGIAGIFGGGEPDEFIELASRMISTIAHRGPEGTRVEAVTGAPGALAHARLAIIDIAGGEQPMPFADGRYTVVLNGEIYNYIELRKELAAKGVNFRTKSDTETLLAAYDQWGASCLERIVGMFAFAIWDRVSRSLFAARDRFGKKPFVYSWQHGRFAFASEAKALAALPDFERRIEPQALELYLALGYVPAPHTIWRGMNKLPAGHSLTWREGRLSVQRYWTPAPRPIAASSKRPGANSREFRELFDEAVRLRFRSDVPVGLFLSGGLDSSMVAVSAVEQGFRPQAFTVAFDAEDIDFPFAEKVARHLHLEHHLIRVTASGAIEDTSRLFHHYDEPFADSSSIPSFQIARATQGHVKVVLNGDAGDEAFAGYGYYKAAAFTFRKRQFASVLGLRDSNPCDPFEVVAAGRLAFPQRERRRLLNGVNPDDGLKAFLRTDSYLSEARKIRLSALRRFMWFDRHVYLPNDLMYKMDIALSAFGIEGRSPFMDHRLMDWAQGLPHGHLVYHGKTKIMLKAALEGRLPRDIVQRQKKGFGSPMRRWLQGELAAPMRDALSSGFFSRLCDRGLPLALANRALARDHALPAWTLFAFELWAQHWKPSL